MGGRIRRTGGPVCNAYKVGMQQGKVIYSIIYGFYRGSVFGREHLKRKYSFSFENITGLHFDSSSSLWFCNILYDIFCRLSINPLAGITDIFTVPV
jgi:hypothetical protein